MCSMCCDAMYVEIFFDEKGWPFSIYNSFAVPYWVNIFGTSLWLLGLFCWLFKHKWVLTNVSYTSRKIHWSNVKTSAAITCQRP